MPPETASVPLSTPVPGGGQFAETHWSVVLEAGNKDAPGAVEALEKLCRAYWYPVYAWIRGRGHDAEDAKDLTQEFLAGLLRRDSLTQVAPEKGRFRTWLIRSIQYFLADQHRAAHAAKRGGGAPIIEWDALDPEQRYALEPRTTDSPDADFDRRWCQILVARAFQRLEDEQTAAGHSEILAVLKDYIGGPGTGDYARAAQALGMSQNTIAVTVRRLRLRCRELIMEEIMHTVETPDEARAELRALFRA